MTYRKLILNLHFLNTLPAFSSIGFHLSIALCMSDVHGDKLAWPCRHLLYLFVGQSVAEANKQIFDPRGIGAPLSGAPIGK